MCNDSSNREIMENRGSISGRLNLTTKWSEKIWEETNKYAEYF
jgi:hypothetical protein